MIKLEPEGASPSPYVLGLQYSLSLILHEIIFKKLVILNLFLFYVMLLYLFCFIFLF